MIAKVFLLALLVVASNASPMAQAQNSGMVNYGDAMTMYLQAWKKMLPCGYAPDHIPAMAPLTIDFYPFDYTNGETSIKGNVSNIRVSGLDNFQILSGSYDSNTQRSTFDVIYPEIQVLGSYELEGTVSLFGFPVPVRQSVLINKKVLDLRYVGDYTFAQSLSNPNGLRISDFNLKYYIADVKADMWDKYLDIATNKFFNNLASSSALLLSEEIQPYVNQIYAKYVLPSINEPLSNVNLAQLTDYFLMQAELWNSVECNDQA